MLKSKLIHNIEHEMWQEFVMHCHRLNLNVHMRINELIKADLDKMKKNEKRK